MQSQSNGRAFPDRAAGNRSNQATANRPVRLAPQTCSALGLSTREPRGQDTREPARPCVGAPDRPASRLLFSWG